MKQDKGYWKFNQQWQLDLNLTNSESQAAMTEFLHGMIRRGLRPPLTMTSDGASGLVGALQAT